VVGCSLFPDPGRPKTVFASVVRVLSARCVNQVGLIEVFSNGLDLYHVECRGIEDYHAVDNGNGFWLNRIINWPSKRRRFGSQSVSVAYIF
jgi:hypothetical protein